MNISVRSDVRHEPLAFGNTSLVLEAGNTLVVEIYMAKGSNVMMMFNYGDSKTDRERVNNWTENSLKEKRHLYPNVGTFEVNIKVRNPLNTSEEHRNIIVYDNVKYVDFAIAKASTTGFIEVKFQRTDNITVTIGTAIELDFGDRGFVKDTNFHIDASYNHTYGNTGDYSLDVTLTNPVSTNKITKVISVMRILKNVQIKVNLNQGGLSLDEDLIIEILADEGTNVTAEYHYGDGGDPELINGGRSLSRKKTFNLAIRHWNTSSNMYIILYFRFSYEENT